MHNLVQLITNHRGDRLLARSTHRGLNGLVIAEMAVGNIIGYDRVHPRID